MDKKEEVVTLKDLVSIVSDSTELSKAKLEEIIKVFLSEVEEQLAQGNKVKLANFGIFKTSFKEAREGMSPITHDTIHIPAKTSAKFTMAKQLKDRLNN